MAMEEPLTELRNQRLPRRKMTQTYGKKKMAVTSSVQKDLFGSDEKDIEAKLADMRLEDSESRKNSSMTSRKSTRSMKDKATTSQPVIRGNQHISEEDFGAVQALLSLSESTVDTFSSFGAKLAKSFNVQKIGEGSFAEVFKVTSKDSDDTTQSSCSPSLPRGGAIIKIIPLKLPSSDPDLYDRLSSVESVAREIRVFRTLDSIHGFTRFRGVRLVSGLWPRIFLDAFRAFRRFHRQRAINKAPDDDFDEKQIYAVVEMDDAGSEVSLIKKPSVFQVYDIFWMTVILLANAEEQVEFEHRDLHLSNVCVKAYDTATEAVDEKGSGSSGEYNYIAPPRLGIDASVVEKMSDDNIPTNKLGLSNIKITIIDYTITRCQLTPLNSLSEAVSVPQIAYDKMRFVSGLGDYGNAEDRTQFATYRKCKAAVELAQRQSGFAENKWKQFVPQTNVAWLAYLLKSLARRAKGRSKKYAIVKGSSKVAKALQEQMWDVLALVEDVVHGVDPNADESGSDVVGEEEGKEFTEEELGRTPGSARELLGRAVEEGWLGREEVEAFRKRLESEA